MRFAVPNEMLCSNLMLHGLLQVPNCEQHPYFEDQYGRDDLALELDFASVNVHVRALKKQWSRLV